MFTQADNKWSGTNKVKINKKNKQSIASRRKNWNFFIVVLLQFAIQLKIDITHEHMYELEHIHVVWKCVGPLFEDLQASVCGCIKIDKSLILGTKSDVRDFCFKEI